MMTCAETDIEDPGVAVGAAAGVGVGGVAGAAGAGAAGRETAGAPGTMPRAIAVVMSTTPEVGRDRLD
jgi:outer membrane lipoprotein SlyB